LRKSAVWLTRADIEPGRADKEMRQPQSTSYSCESCVVRMTPNSETMPVVAHCQLALKPLRSPPCSTRKATALPNSENPCSSRAAVMMIGAAMPIVA